MPLREQAIDGRAYHLVHIRNEFEDKLRQLELKSTDPTFEDLRQHPEFGEARRIVNRFVRKNRTFLKRLAREILERVQHGGPRARLPRQGIVLQPDMSEIEDHGHREGGRWLAVKNSRLELIMDLLTYEGFKPRILVTVEPGTSIRTAELVAAFW